MTYKVLSLQEKNEWNNFLKKLPNEQQDIYYTPEYYSLYENYGDGKARCFVFEKKGEIALYPFLINSINKLGYSLDKEYYDIQGAYGYNGIVSTCNKREFINSFYTDFNNYCFQHNIVAEFTRFHPLINNSLFSNNELDIIFDRKTIYVDLSISENEIFKNFQTSTRKQIKRCINRHNIEIIQKISDTKYLNSFINIYYESMHRVNSIKHLYFNYKYFKELLLSKNVYQFVAIYKDSPIAFITALSGENYLHGHLGGSLTEYLNLSTYSLLYWEMIKKAKFLNKKHLHIGGGLSTEPNDNLLIFKKHFSDKLSDFYIGKKIHNQEIYNEVIKQWSSKHTDSYKKNKNKLLGYREIING
ncbi:GNAT family N-acetyltransferase [Bacteroidota bacterium]